jgi:hypothetical protein
VAQRDGVADGGTLSSRTNILRLNQDDSIDLAVIVAGPESSRTATIAFLTDIGVENFLFFPIDDGNRPDRLRDRLQLRWLKFVGFFWESIAVRHRHVKEAVSAALHRWESDFLVIDYLFSVLFCPALDGLQVPAAIITLNREAEFYRDCVEQKVIRDGPVRAAITGRRLARFERNSYSRAAKVIAIGAPDVPDYLPRSQALCITPYLDEQSEPWRFSDSRTAFFVGNIRHYPIVWRSSSSRSTSPRPLQPTVPTFA